MRIPHKLKSHSNWMTFHHESVQSICITDLSDTFMSVYLRLLTLILTWLHDIVSNHYHCELFNAEEVRQKRWIEWTNTWVMRSKSPCLKNQKPNQQVMHCQFDMTPDQFHKLIGLLYWFFNSFECIDFMTTVFFNVFAYDLHTSVSTASVFQLMSND
jgi:hypothetical protein